MLVKSLYELVYVGRLASNYEDTWHFNPIPRSGRESPFVCDFKCDCKCEKYQLFLDIPLGISPTVIASFITDTANVS